MGGVRIRQFVPIVGRLSVGPEYFAGHHIAVLQERGQRWFESSIMQTGHVPDLRLGLALGVLGQGVDQLLLVGFQASFSFRLLRGVLVRELSLLRLLSGVTGGLKKSLLLRMELTRIEATHCRVRSAIAAMDAGDRTPETLRDAETGGEAGGRLRITIGNHPASCILHRAEGASLSLD